ncbi:MAG TPA: acetyl-CoA C-acyltransferase [Sporichthyaceae bacterium]|jgi:acetyl-CoA acyltransferase
MRDAVIVDAVRTPVGKRNGALADVHPVDLSALVLNELVRRTGVDPAEVEDVIWGVGGQYGEQGLDTARQAVLAAGWPEDVPGVTIDRQCGSSQQAIHFAAQAVLSGDHDVVVAGGVESMTRVAMGITVTAQSNPYTSQGWQARYGRLPNQGIGAEMIAERWGLSRTQLDEFSVRSHELAAAAQDRGLFDDEIVPVGEFSTDEGVRRGGSVEKLAGLKTVFKQDGVIHAGNASQISDGAAALLVMSAEKARALGLTPMARYHTGVLAGADPMIMLTAPIPATEKALKRSGLSIGDIGTFEVNEAFAPVPLAWAADLGADAQRLNPNGGAIAIGHPIGGSGARIATTLLHHMRREGIRYGLQTMCEGGGQANATIFELLG